MKKIVLGTLVLGIVVGISLVNLFRGFGLGPGQGLGKGPGEGGTKSHDKATTQLTGDSEESGADLVGHHAGENSAGGNAPKSSGLVKVVIDDRSYFLRGNDGNTQIDLAALVELIDQTEPNEDGLKAVIDRRGNSRETAVLQLSDALKAAGVPENAVSFTSRAVD